MIYIQLFLSFLQVGALSFGGNAADTGTGGEFTWMAFHERIYKPDYDC